jgi:hypothetical protein
MTGVSFLNRHHFIDQGILTGHTEYRIDWLDKRPNAFGTTFEHLTIRDALKMCAYAEHEEMYHIDNDQLSET